MGFIKKYRTAIFLALLALALPLASRFYLQSRPVFYGPEVQAHYNNFQPKYQYDQCRVWLDYRPRRIAPEFDRKAHEIIQKTILSFNKFMIYNNWIDFGGSPGLHLAFADFCDQKHELAQKIAQALQDQHPGMTSATVVEHSPEREGFDVGKPWDYYLANNKSENGK